MADPARYHVELTHGPHGYDILVERGAAGQWVKWLDFVDYKSAQRSNASLDTNTKLGVEIAEMRSRIKDLEAEVRRLRESSFVTAVPSEEYEKLKAENERLRKAGDAMWNTAQQDGTGLWLHKSFENWHKMNHPRTEGSVK